MDGEAWWAAVRGAAQSRTRLKRLSSSSKSSHIRQYLIMNREIIIFSIKCILRWSTHHLKLPRSLRILHIIQAINKLSYLSLTQRLDKLN